MINTKFFIKKIALRCNKFIKFYFEKFITREKALCRIEEIDLVNNKMVIYCRGTEATIHLSFDQIINDVAMISNFAPKHASWIGYYYGKYYAAMLNKKSNYSAPFDAFTHDGHEEFCIKMLTRQGLLAYLDKKTNELNYMRPIRIMATDHLITKFNPLQACYIGILSGIAKSKPTNHTTLSHHNTVRFTVINSEQCSIL